jgi:hypothetical protein
VVVAAEAVNHAWIHMVVTASVVAQMLIAALTVTHTAVVQRSKHSAVEEVLWY